MILSQQELAELTGRQRCDAQARVLSFMGIEHRRRPDGTLAVSRAHVEGLLGGEGMKGKTAKTPEPNWSAV